MKDQIPPTARLSPLERRQLEARLLMQQELQARSAGDPLRLFKPHRRQLDFIEAVLGDPSLECWALFANRAGKTDAGAYIGATLARFGDPAAKSSRAKGSSVEVRDRATSGWVVSLDYPSSRDIIQPKYFDNGFGPPNPTHQPFIPPREIDHWDNEGKVLRLRNGSLIGFKSCDSGRQKFQGVEKDWVHFDEEPPRDVYTEVSIRVGGGRRLRIFATCTLLPPPGAVGGVTWVYTDKVEPWKAEPTAGLVRVFSASIYDNPYIPREDIARLEALYPAGSIERRIRLNGELIPASSGARLYLSFDHRIHVAPQGHPIERRPLCWVIDFNVQPMVSLVGQREGRLFRVYDEIALEQGSVPQLTEAFRRQYPTWGNKLRIFGDSSGHSREKGDMTARSSYQMILGALATYPAPIELCVPDKNPLVTDRINTVNYTLLNEFEERNLAIDPRCKMLIGDMEQVVSDGRGGVRKSTNLKDPYYRRTHASDALGYWLCREAPVLAEIGRSTRDPGSQRPIPSPSYGRASGVQNSDATGKAPLQWIAPFGLLRPRR